MSSISISYQKLNFFNKNVFRKQGSLGQLKKAGPITTFMIIKKAFGIFLITTREKNLRSDVNANKNLLKRSLPIDIRIRDVPIEVSEESNFYTLSTLLKK